MHSAWVAGVQLPTRDVAALQMGALRVTSEQEAEGLDMSQGIGTGVFACGVVERLNCFS